MKKILGSEKNFYLSLSLPHTKYSIVNVYTRFTEIDINELDLISIYESISQKLLYIIPNCRFAFINKTTGISLLLAPTENSNEFILNGNIQHINSHIASVVTILLKENIQLEKCDPLTTVSCFSSSNKEIINYFIEIQEFQFKSLLFELAEKFYDKEFILSKSPEEIYIMLETEHNVHITDKCGQEDILRIVVIKEQEDDKDMIKSYDAPTLDKEYLSQFIITKNDEPVNTEFDVDAL